MQYVINKLLEDKEKIVKNLKAGKTEELGLLKEYEKAITWLNLINNENLDNANKYMIQTLDTTVGYGYSYYHLMIDMETDDKTRWIEYKPNGEVLELCGGDVIFIRK